MMHFHFLSLFTIYVHIHVQRLVTIEPAALGKQQLGCKINFALLGLVSCNNDRLIIQSIQKLRTTACVYVCVCATVSCLTCWNGTVGH